MMAGDSRSVDPEQEEGVWRVRDGAAEHWSRTETYRDDGTENLAYNNPYGLKVERVWFDAGPWR